MSRTNRYIAPIEVRFAAKVRAVGECWEWTGATADGYGRFGVDRRSVRAHRYAYEWLVGPIPVGLDLDHLCRNRACVNPAHLEPVTRRVNLLRGETLTARNAAKSECLRGHAYTAANTIHRKTGRACLACRRAASAARRKRVLKVRDI